VGGSVWCGVYLCEAGFDRAMSEEGEGKEGVWERDEQRACEIVRVGISSRLVLGFCIVVLQRISGLNCCPSIALLICRFRFRS
jgi:hypothetical protein